MGKELGGRRRALVLEACKSGCLICIWVVVGIEEGVGGGVWVDG